MLADIDPAVEKYFAEIEDCVGLPSESEGEICQCIQDCDEDAVAELVEANLCLVDKVAAKQKGIWVCYWPT